jgi:hypothetical protein
VTVAIANFDGERHLPECLASLARQTQRPADTIVVDAGSSDGSVTIARAAGATVLHAENRGLGHLYNTGAAAATSPLLLLANNDVSFEPSCIELLAAALEADATLFAADPAQLDWDGRTRIHGRAMLRRGPLLRRPLPGFELDQLGAAGANEPTVFANAGAMLVRRDRLLELGGFDETFFLDFEDLDLCWRAWLRGAGSIHVPDALLRHRVGGAMTADVLPNRLRASHHNLVRFALKCLSARNAGRVVVGELLRLPAHPRLIAPALARVATELPAIARVRRTVRPSAAFDHWVLAGQPGPPPLRPRA